MDFPSLSHLFPRKKKRRRLLVLRIRSVALFWGITSPRLAPPQAYSLEGFLRRVAHFWSKQRPPRNLRLLKESDPCGIHHPYPTSPPPHPKKPSVSPPPPNRAGGPVWLSEALRDDHVALRHRGLASAQQRRLRGLPGRPGLCGAAAEGLPGPPRLGREREAPAPLAEPRSRPERPNQIPGKAAANARANPDQHLRSVREMQGLRNGMTPN